MTIDEIRQMVTDAPLDHMRIVLGMKRSIAESAARRITREQVDRQDPEALRDLTIAANYTLAADRLEVLIMDLTRTTDRP